MNNKKLILNDVKDRFLPIPHRTIDNSIYEPKISDFEPIKELGSGSFGQVYLVYHKKTKMKYALKAIDKNEKSNIKERKYFYREIEIMYKINHPNVIKLYGHFEDNNFCYFIMEYAPKGNIYSLIPKHGRKKQSNKYIASIMKDIISIVYYLHNMNPPIIHRDIKPENILLDENNNIKLTDFGWSNYLNDKDKRITVCGTPIYLAPEVINKKGHDERVDIWCIGVLLFELVTGKPPFQGDSMHNLKQNILWLKINWPKNITYEEKDLISKILKYYPKDRLTLEQILEHNYIKKYFPKAKNDLILPYDRDNDCEISKEDIYHGNNINLRSHKDLSPLKNVKKDFISNKENSSHNYSTNDNSCDSYYNNYSNNNIYSKKEEDYSSLLTKYDNLQKEYYSLLNRKKELCELKKELKEKESKILQLKREEYLYKYKNTRKQKEINELKEKYNLFYKENKKLKDKLVHYVNYIKENLIMKKKIEFLNCKEKEKLAMEKERDKFNIIINKYDKALFSEEEENEILTAKLEKLQKNFFI